MEKERDFKISLIIPAYNEEKYIDACLENAIKNSNGKVFEIIVVDNASTDKTAEMAGKYKSVRIVKENNKGVTRARQRGFIESSGNILAFIDADTKMPPGWIEQIISEFKKNNSLVCLSGPYFFYDILAWKSFLIKIYWALAIIMYRIISYMAVGGNLVIKRETLEKFEPDFIMYSSGRRITHFGLLKMAFIYASYFFSEVIKRKSVNQKYIEIR